MKVSSDKQRLGLSLANICVMSSQLEVFLASLPSILLHFLLLLLLFCFYSFPESLLPLVMPDSAGSSSISLTVSVCIRVLAVGTLRKRLFFLLTFLLLCSSHPPVLCSISLKSGFLSFLHGKMFARCSLAAVWLHVAVEWGKCVCPSAPGSVC